MFPLPNYVDPNPTRANSWNYFSAASGGYPRRTETGRVDFSPNDHWQLYTRVNNFMTISTLLLTCRVDGSLNFPLAPHQSSTSPCCGVCVKLQFSTRLPRRSSTCLF